MTLVFIAVVIGLFQVEQVVSQLCHECCNTAVDLDQLQLEEDFIGDGPVRNPCLWPSSPTNGYNFRRCRRGGEETFCRDVTGKPRPHGTSKITRCKDNFLLSLGEECTYCNNGSWSYDTFECVECGHSPFEDVALINQGKSSNRGDFPWMAGLYMIGEKGLWEHFCGGTLISSHLVLTAAHCVKSKNGPFVKPEAIKVGFGKLLKDFYINETTSLIMNVREIVVPPRYVGFAHFYDLDIALLDLDKMIGKTADIMPACVDWHANHTLFDGEIGYLAGFGLTDNGRASETLRWARQKYVEYESCLKRIRPNDLKMVTQDKFCITSVRGAQPENGDSGGGLTFIKNGAHHVYGIVSTKLAEGGVDVVLFTNLLDEKHRNWLLSHWRRLRKIHQQERVLHREEAVVTVPETPPRNCTCVPYYRCEPKRDNQEGIGLLDINLTGEDVCGDYLDVCCENPLEEDSPGVVDVKPQSATNKSKCGIRNPEGIGFSIVGGNDEAEYGEFPWMVAVLRKEAIDTDDGQDFRINLYQCGGSLIHPSVVMTAAHCVDKKENLFVRAGEWDTQTDKELYRVQDRFVNRTIFHENFFRKTLLNDIALLILESPVDLAENVGLVCLPQPAEDMDGRSCLASGWGKDSYEKEGKYQVILKKVEMPTVSKDKCEKKLQSTVLGNGFSLHESFLCAGARGKDTCKGDGGSPLVCPSKADPNVYEQAGVVSWGVECNTDVPGLYVNVPHFVPWILEKCKAEGFPIMQESE